ncbi:hypothetical protein GCM10018782_19340 [Streptomyces griseoaurantiacus]|nr:hypothetical protein GCM10018782_19340 [Streptomyces griseoaurantiacus]
MAKVRAAPNTSGSPSFDLDRNLRSLPGIPRMSARSFPLHAGNTEGCIHHMVVHHMCRSLRCAYLLEHHAPVVGGDEPSGPSRAGSADPGHGSIREAPRNPPGPRDPRDPWDP